MKPSRQAKYRQVEEFLRILDASVSRGDRQGAPAPPDRRRAAADRRPRLRQRLPHLRRPAVPHPRARAAGRGHRRRREAAVAPTTTPPSPTGLGMAADFVVPARSPRSTLDPAPDVVLALHACDTATDEALARAVEWEAPLVLAAPCCHHDIAAQLRKNPDARAVRHAHPARHPARAVRRHPDRRGARVAAAACRATGSTSCSSSRASTRPATPCCARSARAGRCRAARCARSTTTWSRPGRSGPGSPSCSGRRASERCLEPADRCVARLTARAVRGRRAAARQPARQATR